MVLKLASGISFSWLIFQQMLINFWNFLFSSLSRCAMPTLYFSASDMKSAIPNELWFSCVEKGVIVEITFLKATWVDRAREKINIFSFFLIEPSVYNSCFQSSSDGSHSHLNSWFFNYLFLLCKDFLIVFCFAKGFGQITLTRVTHLSLFIDIYLMDSLFSCFNSFQFEGVGNLFHRSKCLENGVFQSDGFILPPSDLSTMN